jgi:Mn2+/Fe2+ NRAMP family transporter
MGVVFVITLVGRKISRTLELVNWVLVGFILITVTIAAILLASPSDWADGLEGMFRPALPPASVDATTIGAVAGFAAMASGLNYVFMSYYRDKGYGMGSKAGHIPALLGGQKHEVAAVGSTFRESPENTALWRRWYRFLTLEMWVVFVPGALIGLLMPGIIVSSVAERSGTPPTAETMPTYVASQLEQLGEPRIFYYWALLVGFLIFFTTQLVVFELLVRSVVDSLYGSSERFRTLIGGDARRLYYPLMVVVAVVISVIIFQALPTSLLQWSANMSNLAALIMPFALMYLISRLPRPAKARWWSYVILVIVAIYFGFFFLNFLVSKINPGSDLSFW